ncbi:MAG: exodeoxyribonuclease V subunit alpha [Candidatus Methylumidiphilus sp.]
MISATPLDRQFAACMRRFDPGMEAAVEWAASLASRALGEGHVCLDLRRWAEREIDPGLRLPSVSAWKEVLFASAVVGGPGEFKPMIVEGERLYLARYWRYEKRLADSLLAMAGDVCVEVDLERLDTDLGRLFALNAGQFPDWQKSAAAVAVLRRFCVISGGPGTGKTSTVVRILAALQSQAQGGLHIALAAPTGKAAARMQDSIRTQKQSLDFPANVIGSIPDTASTVHRLLGSKPDSASFRHDRDNPLLADVVVVDEASMIDLALLAKLVDALPPKARLILLGDKDQLSAVEAGAVFGDICAGWSHRRSFCDLQQKTAGPQLEANETPASPLQECIALLRHSHRFPGDSGIGELARRINEAEEAQPVLELLTDGRFTDIAWVSHFDEADLLERMDAGYRSYFDLVAGCTDGEEVLAGFNRFRVLAAHHAGPASASSTNHAFEALQRERLRTPRYERWYVGRPIMVTRNDYGLRLFNGDVGVCLRVDGELRVCFEDAEGKLRALAPARLPEYVPAYAITVHKSQGSEFDQALFLLPEIVSPVLNRPLVYTAVTRARHRAEIWGGREMLAAAINRAPERSSGLRERLWG